MESVTMVTSVAHMLPWEAMEHASWMVLLPLLSFVSIRCVCQSCPAVQLYLTNMAMWHSCTQEIFYMIHFQTHFSLGKGPQSMSLKAKSMGGVDVGKIGFESWFNSIDSVLGHSGGPFVRWHMVTSWGTVCGWAPKLPSCVTLALSLNGVIPGAGGWQSGMGASQGGTRGVVMQEHCPTSGTVRGRNSSAGPNYIQVLILGTVIKGNSRKSLWSKFSHDCLELFTAIGFSSAAIFSSLPGMIPANQRIP